MGSSYQAFGGRSWSCPHFTHEDTEVPKRIVWECLASVTRVGGWKSPKSEPTVFPANPTAFQVHTQAQVSVPHCAYQVPGHGMAKVLQQGGTCSAPGQQKWLFWSVLPRGALPPPCSLRVSEQERLDGWRGPSWALGRGWREWGGVKSKPAEQEVISPQVESTPSRGQEVHGGLPALTLGEWGSPAGGEPVGILEGSAFPRALCPPGWHRVGDGQLTFEVYLSYFDSAR